jgi:hypothetical protein
MLLNGTSINANHGEVYGLSFLIRTPELIEDGLRSILATHIVSLPIKKRKLFLGDSGLSINPDLVFGNNLAIGDVKYRRITQDWSRSDLYQAVAFATGFRSSHAAIFGFSEAASNPLPRSVKIGDVDTRAFTWISDPNLSPKHSESLLATQVSSWLLGIA